MLQAISEYALSFPGSEGAFPFDEKTLVVKVMGKMFLLINIEDPSTVNLKCDPERAALLRAEHDEVMPGYHMNKKHWNTVRINGSLPWSFVCELIDHSYDLVVRSLTKAQRSQLEALNQ